jgi:hypothetical protein
MNEYRVTYTYKGEVFTEWYTAKNERIALVMLGAELSDEWINNLDDVRVVIETN